MYAVDVRTARIRETPETGRGPWLYFPSMGQVRTSNDILRSEAFQRRCRTGTHSDLGESDLREKEATPWRGCVFVRACASCGRARGRMRSSWHRGWCRPAPCVRPSETEPCAFR